MARRGLGAKNDGSWRRFFAGALLIGAAACSSSGGEASPGGIFDGSVAARVTDATGASLGSVAFPVSCGEEAGADMRLGLALLHNMTYTEAEAAFRRAAELDPGCSMALWGMAMTYLHPLWPDVPSAEQLRDGWRLLQDARTRGLKTPWEKAYVSALEAYYRNAEQRDEPTRLSAYAAAWTDVSSSFPHDPEAALFHALSTIATAPGGDPSFAAQADAGAIAEAVLEAIDDHPGAHHYVIHAFDVPPLAERALPVARSYGKVAPANTHALHMTSHIFTRRGLWEESIDYNRRAAEAAWQHPIEGRTSHHHLHAIDYLAYAYLQTGADDEAQEVLDHLRTLTGPVVDHAASAYAFAAVPARMALERQRWVEAAELPTRWPSFLPWDSYPHLEAIPEFARALGGARSGNLNVARNAARRLAELHTAAADLPSAYDWGTQVEIQEIGARAWIAFADGHTSDALSLMTRAADLEASTQKNPVTPGEVLPARELLGDMLMQLGQHQEAMDAYATVLDRSRNRFNSLHGAGLAAELLGRKEVALDYYRQLLEVAGSSTTRAATLERVEAYLAEEEQGG